MNHFRPAVACALAALAACSGGEDGSVDDDASASASVSAAQPAVTAGIPVTTLADRAPSVTEATSTAPTVTAAPAPTATTAPIAMSPSDTVPEAGVPGLDSADLFCAAWSRFGGTWQVLLVGSTFLDDPDRVARWEVSSAPLVVGAYAELLAQLPGELEPEREALADGSFGALERRARDARDALVDGGANGADIAGLSEAWLAALESRDPSTPDVAFVEPDFLVGLVDVASADLLGRRTEFHLDPSLVVTVETPLTDAYLETSCPDQGTLAGGEVGG